MSTYEIRKFKCPSRGITQIVAQIQSIPKNWVAAPINMGAVPDVEGALNRCLKLIDRLQLISDKSAAGRCKEEAIMIGFEVYRHLQESLSWYNNKVNAHDVSLEAVGGDF
jgi:hypothetical protein